MPYHWHAECELIYLCSGTLNLSVDGKIYKLDKGDTIFLNSEAVHGGISEHCDYECLVFDLESLFSGAKLCMQEFQPIMDSIGMTCLVFSSGSNVSKTAETMFAFMCEKPKGYHFFGRGELMKLLGYMMQTNDLEKGTALTPAYLKKLRKLKLVIRYISEHYREQIALCDLAEQCGMNANYFCRAFKEFTGMTPVEYLNFYRIESACEQISKMEGNITNIAFLCGFNDFSYFIKVFKKFKGVTPSKYAKKLND